MVMMGLKVLVFGKVVAVCCCGPARRLCEPGPGHPATSTITGWGCGGSRGSGMVERLRCQTPSTTVKPVPQTHCWRPLTGLMFQFGKMIPPTLNGVYTNPENY